MDNKVAQPKFTIGEQVKFMNDNDGEAGRVLSFRYDPANGWQYTISSRELDIPNKQVVEGVKHCREEELVAVQNAVNTPAATPNKQVELGDKVNE